MTLKMNELGEFEPVVDFDPEARRAEKYKSLREIDPKKCNVRDSKPQKHERPAVACAVCGRVFYPHEPGRQVCPICQRRFK